MLNKHNMPDDIARIETPIISVIDSDVGKPPIHAPKTSISRLTLGTASAPAGVKSGEPPSAICNKKMKIVFSCPGFRAALQSLLYSAATAHDRRKWPYRNSSATAHTPPRTCQREPAPQRRSWSSLCACRIQTPNRCDR